jgi:hypothetical protein
VRFGAHPTNKPAGAWGFHLVRSAAEINNALSYTSTLPYVSKPRCLIRHGKSLSFTLTRFEYRLHHCSWFFSVPINDSK